MAIINHLVFWFVETSSSLYWRNYF